MHVEAGELNHSLGAGLNAAEEYREVPPYTLLIIDNTIETDVSEVKLEPHEMLVIDALMKVRQIGEGWCSRGDIYDAGFLEDAEEGTRNRQVKAARERVASITFGCPPRSIIEDNGLQRGGKRVRIKPELQIVDAREADKAMDLGEVIAAMLETTTPEPVMVPATLTGLDDGLAGLLEEAASATDQNEVVTPDKSGIEAPEEEGTIKSENPEQDPALFMGLARTAQTLIYDEASPSRRKPPANVMYKKQTMPKVQQQPRKKRSRDQGEGSSRQSRQNGYVPKSEDSVAIYLHDIGQHPLLTKEGEVYMAQTIEAGNIAKEIVADPEYGGLPIEQQAKLRRIVRVGTRSEAEFIQSNLRLVVSVAKRYQASGMPLLDLIQEGNLGLIHAVEKFDWRKGFKFSTYATWWIQQSITRGIANTGRTVRIPVHALDSLGRLTKARTRLETKLGRAAKLSELADELELPEERVIQILEYAADVLSLNEPVNHDSAEPTELGELVEDKNAEDPVAVAATVLLPAIVVRALSGLDDRERSVMKLRFGLDGSDPRTLEEVGSEFGLTRERIRQIESKAMSKIRHPSAGGLLRNVAAEG